MRQHVRGFTLLEMVAAIAILALSAVVLMKALGGSMALTHHAATYTKATAWAQSLLDSAYVMRRPVAGITHGRFDKRYRWQLTVEPWQPSATGSVRVAQRAAPEAGTRLRLYKLDLAVMWGPPVHAEVAHFETLRVARVKTPSQPP